MVWLSVIEALSTDHVAVLAAGLVLLVVGSTALDPLPAQPVTPRARASGARAPRRPLTSPGTAPRWHRQGLPNILVR